MKLYNFHRSSASWRVRIALALKGLEADVVTVNLRSGEQRMADFLEHAPSGLVPAFEDASIRLGQSLAIMQYLDDAYPKPPLIPRDRVARAQAWELALTIACDIHPLNNLRVLQYLEREVGVDGPQRGHWYAGWVTAGFETFETLLARNASGGPFCLGAEASIADACLVPQLANARRFDVPVEQFSRMLAIDAYCRTVPAFIAATVPMSDDPAASDIAR